MLFMRAVSLLFRRIVQLSFRRVEENKRWDWTGEVIALILQSHCGFSWLVVRPWGWGLDGKHPQQERDRAPLLERWLGEEQDGCGEEPVFLALGISAAAQLVPFPRSVWWSDSEVWYLLKSWVRAVPENFSTAGNSLFHTHLSDSNSKLWVRQIFQAVSSLLAKL